MGWLFRELSGPYLLFLALWNPEITWRTRIYKLAWGGKAYELDTSKESITNSMFEKDARQFGGEDLEMKAADKSIRSIDINHELGGEPSGIQIISSIGGGNDSNLVHMRDVVKQSTVAIESNNHHHLHHYRSFSSSSLLDKQQNQQQIIRLHQLKIQEQQQQQQHKFQLNNLFAPSTLSMPKIKS